jgi:hypothetical protein
MATSDRPTVDSVSGSAPATSCRDVTTARRLIPADHDQRGLDDPGRDVAERDALALALDDRKQHDRGRDVGDREQNLKERAHLHACVGAGPEDVGGVVEHRVIEKERGDGGDERDDE